MRLIADGLQKQIALNDQKPTVYYNIAFFELVVYLLAWSG